VVFADLTRGAMTEFQEKLRQQHEESMHRELEALLNTANKAEAEISRKDFNGFKDIFHRFLQVKGPSVDWAKINRPPEDSVQPYEKIKAKGLPDNISACLNKLAVVKLNGGLGTSMGCKGPKSLISVRNENTFLDLTVQQIEHLNKTFSADVPLVLMNSFNTDEDTKKILQKYKHHRVNIHTFNQSSLDAGSLTMSKKREFPTTPHVKLGSSFTKVQEFLTRFESIPDMLELDHLTVSGDVTFGKNVSLKGTVIIIANHGDRIDIPAGAMLENKIVSGNLRILDH
ncbi:UTP--glucose-1-phosphate uridylyltransferase, partial [Nibea albiflora]